MTRGRLRRGAFSPLDLQATIHRYLATHNADPKPFVWIMTPQKIMARLKPPNASMDQDFLVLPGLRILSACCDQGLPNHIDPRVSRAVPPIASPHHTSPGGCASAPQSSTFGGLILSRTSRPSCLRISSDGCRSADHIRILACCRDGGTRVRDGLAMLPACNGRKRYGPMSPTSSFSLHHLGRLGIGCLALLAAAASAGAAAAPKLIIVDTASDRFGDSAAPANVARNMAFIASTGLDGVVLHTDVGWEVMLHGVTYEDAMAELAPLQGRMHEVDANFVLTYVMNVDPFDDWSAVVTSWTALARAARDTGLVGIVFDNEAYNGDVWTYPQDVKYGGSRTLAQYQEQYRRRGRELMAALGTVWPELHLLVMHGPYMSDPRTPEQVVLDQGAVTDHDLSGFFFAGLLEAAPATAKVIDGGEVYQYRSAADFANSYRYRKVTMPALAGGTLIPPALRPLWPTKSDIAFGVFDEPWIPAYPMDLAIFEATLANALRQADSYVWIYAERHNYLRPGGVGEEWLEAVQRAKAAAKVP